MSMIRSLTAVRQANTALNLTSLSIINSSDGCVRLKRNMTDHPSSEASLFSPRPHMLSFPSPIDMSHAGEQISDLSPALSSASPSIKPHSLSEYSGGYPKFHHHTISEGSNDSSPTTTISTVDDSSATEPSPGSSPESPPPSTFAVGMLRPRSADETGHTFFELQKQPPPRKGRNLKGLAVNTARQPGQKAASTTSLGLAPVKQDVLASLSSPAFIKLPAVPKTKKRPSNLGLTLLTPSAGNKAPPEEIHLSIPPTPAFCRPTLRHFQSSPSLPAFPGRGMSASSLHAQIPSALQTIISPIEPSRQSVLPEEEEEQNFDIPLSREEKPEAYPNGPITVYDPNIDLYLEPTVEECRKYDVIMNVANEVRNPFLAYDGPDPTAKGIRVDGGGGIQLAPKRAQHSALLDGSVPTTHDSSPTTPKATPLNTHFPLAVPSVASNDPEYIHIKWDHNSDIVPDLFRLVKLIDDRVQDRKRILIHCQCGVSRSASLLVAYGLYKNPSLSVQEAYDTVKKRSKWIGPNMNLIMQLQEFRTSLARGGVLPSDRGMSPITPSSAYREWRGPFSSNPSSPPPHKSQLSAAVSSTSDPVPVSPSAVSPGPSSAPSGLVWPDIGQYASNAQMTQTMLPRAVQSTTAYVDPSGHVVPVLKLSSNLTSPPKLLSLQTMPSASTAEELESITPTEALASPRSEHFAMTSLHPPTTTDAADSFGLMSPTTNQFSTSPFDRSALLASLGMGSVREHEEAPRRSLSMQARTQEISSPSLLPPPGRRLRGKISSPTLREQKELQSLQAKIEASLSLRPKRSLGRLIARLDHTDDALMSPRVMEFTKNPFALSLPLPASEPSRTWPADPPRSTYEDPRSPAQSGVNPITRNILDAL